MPVSEHLPRVAIVCLAVLAYYGGFHQLAKKPFYRAVGRAQRLRVARRYSLNEMRSILGLGASALGQLCFCIVLVTILSLPGGGLLPEQFSPSLILAGIALGIGEMALVSFLCHVAMKVAMKAAPASVPADMEGWKTLVQGGWMQQFTRTAALAPLPVAITLFVLYIAVEELVFRSVLIHCALPLGGPAALLVSVALFITVQVFGMPSWRSAMFPIIGALVVGLVHGLLFLAVPDVLPLIVAHCVYFLIAVL